MIKMDIFAQKKLLLRIVFILIALNMFSIGVFVWKDVFHDKLHKERTKNFQDISNILQKKLSLTEIQVNQVKELRVSFFEKEKVLSEIIRSERDSMNEAMFSKLSDEEQIKSIARRIADNEYQMELLRLEQSKQLKSICTSEQMDKFGDLVKEIRDYFRPENPPGKR